MLYGFSFKGFWYLSVGLVGLGFGAEACCFNAEGGTGKGLEAVVLPWGRGKGRKLACALPVFPAIVFLS